VAVQKVNSFIPFIKEIEEIYAFEDGLEEQI
jgi:hypothetical protein